MTTKKFDNTPAYKIQKLVVLMNKEADEVIKKTSSLSYTQFLILFMINSHKAKSQKQVACYLNFTEAAASKQIESLRKKEFLTREINPQNRREHILAMTEEGIKELNKAHNQLDNLGKSTMEILDKLEIEMLDKILDKLISNAYKSFHSISK